MKRLKDWVSGTSEEWQLLTHCREVVKKIVPNKVEVIFFGSRARGDATPDSDYDLLVLVDKSLTRNLERDICHTLYAIERETNTVLSVQVFERHQWFSSKFQSMPFSQNIEREGILI